MSQPHETSRTIEALPPEPQSESSIHSSDCPTDDAAPPNLHQESHATSQDSSIATGSNVMNEGRLGISQPFKLLRFFYSTSRYLDNQYVDEWIDELDSFGGRLVRAAIENAMPNVWAASVYTRGYFVGRTYHINERYIEARPDNPKNAPEPKRNRVRRASRQRAKALKRGG